MSCVLYCLLTEIYIYIYICYMLTQTPGLMNLSMHQLRITSSSSLGGWKKAWRQPSELQEQQQQEEEEEEVQVHQNRKQTPS